MAVGMAVGMAVSGATGGSAGTLGRADGGGAPVVGGDEGDVGEAGEAIAVGGGGKAAVGGGEGSGGAADDPAIARKTTDPGGTSERVGGRERWRGEGMDGAS